MRRGALASLYDFTSPDARLCLLTFAGGGAHSAAAQGAAARLAFRLDDPAELGDGRRSFTLTPGEAALVNPNTGALPPGAAPGTPRSRRRSTAACRSSGTRRGPAATPGR